MMGERISHRQEQLHIKTKTLLDSMGVTSATMSRWKNDINEPDDATKLLLARELDTSVSWLVGEIDDPAPLCRAAKFLSAASSAGGEEEPAILFLAQAYNALKRQFKKMNQGERSAVKGLLDACTFELHHEDEEK